MAHALLETAAGIPYDTGLLIFGISIALYTAFGGFRASVLNDAMQGLVMLIGTILLLVAVIHAAGGLHSAVDKLQQSRSGVGFTTRRRSDPQPAVYGFVLDPGVLWRDWPAAHRRALYLV
ncbi:Pantothenate permease [Serratia fonticola]|uniref:Pantothenate permease n=1 Tax=Serratia fonticola TaxID=47917 RepID=A0A4U9WAF1_SERFO|nr:Pantothenate permease [Serratia fonticola]